VRNEYVYQNHRGLFHAHEGCLCYDRVSVVPGHNHFVQLGPQYTNSVKHYAINLKKQSQYNLRYFNANPNIVVLGKSTTVELNK
jgi:hypothetical protein